MELLAQFSLWAQAAIMGWGYPGVFLVSFLGNASIFFPVPSFFLVFAAGGLLDPWVVAFVAGAGAALGEMTGYLLGLGSRKALKARFKDQITWLNSSMKRYGAFPIIVVFAATPLPDDLVGIVAGLIRYDFRKFFLATFLGKLMLNAGLAWAGFYGSYVVGGSPGLINTIIVVAIFVIAYHAGKAIMEWRKGRK